MFHSDYRLAEPAALAKNRAVPWRSRPRHPLPGERLPAVLAVGRILGTISLE